MCRGGKKYSFRGGENEEKGLVMNTVEDILNMMEIAKQGARPRKSSPEKNSNNY
jgi:hypothetical protein